MASRASRDRLPKYLDRGFAFVLHREQNSEHVEGAPGCDGIERAEASNSSRLIESSELHQDPRSRVGVPRCDVPERLKLIECFESAGVVIEV